MKTRFSIIALILLAAGCKARNQRSDLVITSVIPPTATTTGTGATASVSCAFDPNTVEYTPFLPYNPAENRGMIAAVVQNNLTDTTTVNSATHTNSTMFLPEQAVVDYEFIPGAGGAPGQQVIPTTGPTVPSGGQVPVGIEIFRGVNLAPPAGTYVRVTMHLEGKLNDGSIVRTSEREYLFQFCTAPGCGSGGVWSASVNGINVSCL